METVDALVIGGGIAGVSAGYELAGAGLAVRLVEAEQTLAFHSTGRSAAHYLENYGPDAVRRLTIGSNGFFSAPPAALVEGPLWSPRAMLMVGDATTADRLRAEVERDRRLVPTTRFVEGADLFDLCPALDPALAAGASLEPDAMELDVAAIHQAFLRGLRARGGVIDTGSPVAGLERRGSGWRVELGDGSIEAGIVVNAAGSWCDRIATMAGLAEVGLRPLRRTGCIASVPDDVDVADWPLVAFDAGDGSMDGYCKPEPGGLLVSPADETPTEPCDARPEEIDVARGLDAMSRWTTLELRHVRTAWAGLRSFVADRALVIGEAADGPGFFWLAGQGGYGIQTAPAAARALASLVVDEELPVDLVELGLTPADLAADRPGLAGELLVGH